MKTLITIFLIVICNVILSQEPSKELIFDCIKNIVNEQSVRNEVSTIESGKTIVYFWYNQNQTEFKSDNGALIKILNENELFERHIGCHIRMTKTKQIGKKLFLDLKLEHMENSNNSCDVKYGMAKFRVYDQKLLKLKWL